MRLSHLVVVVGALAAAGSATNAYARSEVCKRVSEKEIAGLFDRWNASLQTGDAHKVVANYAPKSVLLPTVSNQPRVSAADKEEYFEHFLAQAGWRHRLAKHRGGLQHRHRRRPLHLHLRRRQCRQGALHLHV